VDAIHFFTVCHPAHVMDSPVSQADLRASAQYRNRRAEPTTIKLVNPLRRLILRPGSLPSGGVNDEDLASGVVCGIADLLRGGLSGWSAQERSSLV
jgi:hypothetical protein